MRYVAVFGASITIFVDGSYVVVEKHKSRTSAGSVKFEPELCLSAFPQRSLVSSYRPKHGGT